MSGLQGFIGPGARLLPAQAEGSAARWAERRDPSDGPAFSVRHGRLPAPHIRRAVRAADCPVRVLHLTARPHFGARRARARRMGRRPADRPTGLPRRTDDLAAQGHGSARPAARDATCTGRGRLRDSSRADLLHRLDLRGDPPCGRRTPDARVRAAGRVADHPPGVEIICRDRAGAYAEGARLGAPTAIQVADRFHLWQGIGRAVETCVAAHRECLNAPTSPEKADIKARSHDSARVGPAPDGRRAQRKKAAHALIHELLAQGRSRRAIARHLGWGLNTTLRYARAATWEDTLRNNRPRPSRLNPYKPYLERRFAAGHTNVTRLHHELPTNRATGHRLAHASPLEQGRARRAEGRPGPAVPNWMPPPNTSATSARFSPSASASRSPPGLTPSTPANCPASPTSPSTCSAISTR
ncbi:transposase [Streptomyces sp. NPDC088560]|uniref:transposase n=1 Tax=Streptomyces sp. NPDC088560 TaxID=3365868 RepID=UPI0037FE4B09